MFENHTTAEEMKSDLLRQLNAVASWITHYQRVRVMYMAVRRKVQQSADIVVSGMADIEEITNVILSEIRDQRMSQPEGE